MHQIRFSSEALADLQGSYEWGIDNWGVDAADAWYDKLNDSINLRLSQIPLGCPVAPKSAQVAYEIRQMIAGRYRVLFTVIESDVLILRIRGPFVSGQEL